MSEHDDYTSTHSGIAFYFLNPQPEMIEINDIAVALSRQPRWNGHTKIPITVAQHSVIVSHMLLRQGCSPMVQMQGLMHDAAEAYLGDVPSPIKKHLPDFVTMEILVTGAIFDRFGIDHTMDPMVKMCDKESYRWEYRDLMRGNAIEEPMGPRPILKVWGEGHALDTFLDTFESLKEALDARAA